MDQTTSRIGITSNHTVKDSVRSDTEFQFYCQKFQQLIITFRKLMETYAGPDLQVFSLKFQMSISAEEGVPSLVPPMKATSQSLIWTWQ